MNYYIQGSKENADKIKAAFEKLGIDVLDFGFADKTVVYCSIGGACVQSLPYGINLMHILHSHPGYKELELPVQPEFKVGDWIVRGEGFVYEPSLITEIRDYYICELLNGERVTYTLNDVHKNFHLWTIADAKDGDVLVSGIDNPFIYNGNNEFSSVGAYIGISRNGMIKLDSRCWTSATDVKPATKEQRDLLFVKMKEVGYQWDADKKELRKIKPHYDIANFQPKQWVLVRDDDEWEWALTMFSYLSNGSASLFVCINGASFQQCIPFEGNEKLLGTTDMPSEEYINW